MFGTKSCLETKTIQGGRQIISTHSRLNVLIVCQFQAMCSRNGITAWLLSFHLCPCKRIDFRRQMKRRSPVSRSHHRLSMDQNCRTHQSKCLCDSWWWCPPPAWAFQELHGQAPVADPQHKYSRPPAGSPPSALLSQGKGALSVYRVWCTFQTQKGTPCKSGLPEFYIYWLYHINLKLRVLCELLSGTSGQTC